MTKLFFLLLFVPLVFLVLWIAFLLLSFFASLWLASAVYDALFNRPLPKANW